MSSRLYISVFALNTVQYSGVKINIKRWLSLHTTTPLHNYIFSYPLCLFWTGLEIRFKNQHEYFGSQPQFLSCPPKNEDKSSGSSQLDKKRQFSGWTTINHLWLCCPGQTERSHFQPCWIPHNISPDKILNHDANFCNFRITAWKWNFFDFKT